MPNQTKLFLFSENRIMHKKENLIPTDLFSINTSIHIEFIFRLKVEAPNRLKF